MKRVVLTLLLALLALPVSAGTGRAQDKAQPAPPAESGAAPAAAAPSSEIPDGAALSILIRRTLLTLNDANMSGNYSVLRDLAAPGFQTTNNAARLAEIFASIRKLDLDLAPVIYFDPKLVRQPEIDANGMLRLSGFIPTRPQQINFDMLFQKVANRWRLFGIAVNTAPAPDGAVSAAPAGAPANAAAPNKK